MEHPTKSNVIELKQIFKYLKGTVEKGIEFTTNEEDDEIIAYSDSDYAGDPETRKSTTEYIIMCRGGPIGWSSRKQRTIALSSTEAEYIAVSECCRDAYKTSDRNTNG